MVRYRASRADRRVAIVGLVVGLAFVLTAGAGRASAQGNSDAAMACQKEGYLSVKGADGTIFHNTGQCARHVARGGTLVPLNSAVSTNVQILEENFLVVSITVDPSSPEAANGALTLELMSPLGPAGGGSIIFGVTPNTVNIGTDCQEGTWTVNVIRNGEGTTVFSSTTFQVTACTP